MIVSPKTATERHQYRKRANLAAQYIKLKKRQAMQYSSQRQSRLADMAKELGYQ